MLILNCNFFQTFYSTIAPIIGLKCLVLKVLCHCAISFLITFYILGDMVILINPFLAESEPHHAYSCHAYRKTTTISLFDSNLEILV